MCNTTPYTYLIGWSRENLWYYGVRYKKGCSPEDFWIKYFTSSKRVSKCRSIYGEPDIIQIRKTFKDSYSARRWENNVLRRLNVVGKDKWLNQVYSDSWYNFVSYNREPHNKIKNHFNLQCPYCKTTIKLKETKANKKRKTCGSKSCAAKYTADVYGMSACGGHNKIDKTFNWSCEYCGNEKEIRDTAKNRKKRFCSKSCYRKMANENRFGTKMPRKNKTKTKCITNGTETKRIPVSESIPENWSLGRHWNPR